MGGKAEDIPVEETEKKSSMLGAYANLCNVTIGAGIVGLVSCYSSVTVWVEISELLLCNIYQPDLISLVSNNSTTCQPILAICH